jgi:hypothetical protein
VHGLSQKFSFFRRIAVRSGLLAAVETQGAVARAELQTAIERQGAAARAELLTAIERLGAATQAVLLTAIERGEAATRAELLAAIEEQAIATRTVVIAAIETLSRAGGAGNAAMGDALQKIMVDQERHLVSLLAVIRDEQARLLSCLGEPR